MPYGWVVLSINIIFLICWISAAAVYQQDGTDVCNACSVPGSAASDDGYSFEISSGDTTLFDCYLQQDNSWGPNPYYNSDNEKRMVEPLGARASVPLELVDITVTLIKLVSMALWCMFITLFPTSKFV